MTAGGHAHSAQSADGLIDRRLADELLRAGQYEQVVVVLCAAQTRCAQVGDAFTAHILEMTSQLALACKQCRDDAAWHEQAHREAERREQGLREQLHSALNLIGSGRASSISPRSEMFPGASLSTSELLVPARRFVERSRLWQHILSLVGPKRTRQVTPSESLDVSLAVTEQRPIIPTTTVTEPIDATATDDLAAAEQAPLVPAAALDTLSSDEIQAVPLPPDESEQAIPAAPGPRPVEPKEPKKPALAVYCLGHFSVYHDDQPIGKLTSSKSKSIFKYLIAHRERPVPKEVLMELFWPDVPPDAARNNLNVAIYGLRQALRQTHPSFSHILFRDDCYLLNPDLSVWVDSEAFEEHVAAGLALQKNDDLEGAIREYQVAEELYQGDFMAEDRYEDWPVFQRQRLQTQYLELLQQLSRIYLQRGDYATCATVCNKMLVVDPCYELAHRWLMRCYSRQEQPYLALRQYHLCVERLLEDLDAPPTEKTEALYRQIRQGKPV